MSSVVSSPLKRSEQKWKPEVFTGDLQLGRKGDKRELAGPAVLYVLFLKKVIMVPFEFHRAISQFLQKKFFLLQASSTVMPALLNGDLISMSHFSPVSVIVSILSKLAKVWFVLSQ